MEQNADMAAENSLSPSLRPVPIDICRNSAEDTCRIPLRYKNNMIWPAKHFSRWYFVIKLSPVR
jgi:hypothetical protein